MRIASNVIGLPTHNLSVLNSKAILKFPAIIQDPIHPLHAFFTLHPSGWRHRILTRLANTFVLLYHAETDVLWRLCNAVMVVETDLPAEFSYSHNPQHLLYCVTGGIV